MKRGQISQYFSMIFVQSLSTVTPSVGDIEKYTFVGKVMDKWHVHNNLAFDHALEE